MVKIACLEKIWFLRYLGPSQGRGRFRALRDHSSKAKISGTKRTNRNQIGFSDRTKTVLSKCPFSNFEPIHSISLEIEAENPVLKQDQIYISGQSFKYFSRLCHRIILIFVSSKKLIVGAFWWKLHFWKNSSPGDMVKNVNFEKSAKNGKNGGFSCFFSNSDQNFLLIFFLS